MKIYKIGIWPGDGIGPEVVREGVKVLEEVARIRGFRYEPQHIPFGAEYTLATGKEMTASDVDKFKELDAILYGAGGLAKGDTRLPQGWGTHHRLRLDLWLSVRPAVLYAEHLCPIKSKKPGDIDLVLVREGVEDSYVIPGGFLRRGTPDEVAIGEMIHTRKSVERTIRYAYDLARSRNKKHQITLVIQAPVIQCHDLWQRTFLEVGEEYPDIEKEMDSPDTTAMWMVKSPEKFDVIVTTNFIGNILSDIGAIIQGGLGVAPGARINPGKVSLFEPIHGTAPKYAGKNVVCPLATIAALAMLLDYIGEKDAAKLVEDSMRTLLQSGRVPSVDARSGIGTSQMGDMVLETMRLLAKF